mgnify:FL=1
MKKLLMVCISIVCCTFVVSANTSSERAIEGLKNLNLKPGTKFVIYAEDITIKMAKVNAKEFNRLTGHELITRESPFLEHRIKILQDAMGKRGTYDIVFLMTSWMGDFYNTGYLTPLTKWVNKYDPELDDMVAPFNKVWSSFANEVYGLPTDGDTWILYYRKDLFEDENEQKKFKQKYGYNLLTPRTWGEFNDIAEFFTRPSEGLYGATEWRVKGLTYPWFIQRLGSLGGNYFDKNMNAAINSAEGVRGLKDLKHMNKFMSKDVLSYGYVETLASFSQGKAAMVITWPAAGKNFVDVKGSKVVGKVGYTTVPGYIVNGKHNPKTMNFAGYSLVVNSKSKKPKEAVYLVAQWLVSKEQMKRANMNLSGNTDVIRKSIFNDKEMRSIFEGADLYLDAQMANIAQGFPDLIIPGNGEYMQALEIEISRYMTDEIKSPKKALDNVAKKWDKITKKFGKEKQLKLYNALLDSYYN